MANSVNNSNNNTNTNKLLFIADIRCIFSEVERARSSDFHDVGYTDDIPLRNTKKPRNLHIQIIQMFQYYSEKALRCQCATPT